jgi:predicted small lipoprotein YifL
MKGRFFSLVLLLTLILAMAGCGRPDPARGYSPPPSGATSANQGRTAAPAPVEGGNSGGGIPASFPATGKYSLNDFGPRARLFALSDFDGDAAEELFVVFDNGEPDPAAASGYYAGTYIAIPVYALYRNMAGQWVLSFSSSTTTLVFYPVVWKDSGTRSERNTEPMPYCHNLDDSPGDEILLGYIGVNYSGCLVLKILKDRIVEAGSLNSLEYVIDKAGPVDRTYLVRYEGASQFNNTPEKGLFQKYACYFLNASCTLSYVKDLPGPVFDSVYKAKRKYLGFSGKILDFQFLFWFCYANNPAVLNDAWIRDISALVKPASEAEKWELRRLTDVFRKRLGLQDKEFTDYLKAIGYQWKFE